MREAAFYFALVVPQRLLSLHCRKYNNLIRHVNFQERAILTWKNMVGNWGCAKRSCFFCFQYAGPLQVVVLACASVGLLLPASETIQVRSCCLPSGSCWPDKVLLSQHLGSSSDSRYSACLSPDMAFVWLCLDFDLLYTFFASKTALFHCLRKRWIETWAMKKPEDSLRNWARYFCKTDMFSSSQGSMFSRAPHVRSSWRAEKQGRHFGGGCTFRWPFQIIPNSLWTVFNLQIWDERCPCLIFQCSMAEDLCAANQCQLPKICPINVSILLLSSNPFPFSWLLHTKVWGLWPVFFPGALMLLLL